MINKQKDKTTDKTEDEKASDVLFAKDGKNYNVTLFT